MKNKNKKKSKILKIMFSYLVYLIVGFGIGFISSKYFKTSVNTSSGNNSFAIFVSIYKFIFIFAIGYFVHIIIHEAGHLVFGLMTGYSFVSFRVGSFTIIREDGKFKYKKFNIPGTGGQCLMMPPESKDGRYPFVLYNLGGVIMNLIVSIIGFMIVKNIDGVSDNINTILMLSGLAGIIGALTNGIPMKIAGIANDGYNILSMLKDEEARRGFYLQLRVNGLQSQGIRIKDIPLETFKLKDDADFSNPLNTSIKLMEHSWYLDNMDFDGARQCIESLIPYFDKIIALYVNEINCERIFLELIGDCDKKIIDDLYDKNIKKYIKAAKFMISKKRLLMAYEIFYNDDKVKSLKYYEEIKKMVKKYPVKGDADMELMLVDMIKEKAFI